MRSRAGAAKRVVFDGSKHAPISCDECHIAGLFQTKKDADKMTMADMNKGKYSIVSFYERRARRILPALFFVMFCCLPFAWIWFLPENLNHLSQSLVANSIFLSNILFWQGGGGYFDIASEMKPLLHTWSLAVEEQFYLFFPLFLMAMWKIRKRWIFGSLMAIAAVSLAMAQWGAYHMPSATFYLLPTRGWELAIGGTHCLLLLYKREQS
jgi:peptidoglycan/LPS O-acetylase OafA/YrhL